jgi:hypothetical protein
VLGIEAVEGVVGHQVVAGRCTVGDVDGAAVSSPSFGKFWFAHIADIRRNQLIDPCTTWSVDKLI